MVLKNINEGHICIKEEVSGEKHVSNEKEVEHYQSTKDKGSLNKDFGDRQSSLGDYDSTKDSLFKPWSEKDEEEHEILMDLVDEGKEDPRKGKKKRNTITGFKQKNQMEKEALLNGRSIRAKNVDITLLHYIMDDGYQSHELTSLKTHMQKMKILKSFPNSMTK